MWLRYNANLNCMCDLLCITDTMQTWLCVTDDITDTMQTWTHCVTDDITDTMQSWTVCVTDDITDWQCNDITDTCNCLWLMT